MRQLVAIGSNDRNKYFVLRFPGLPECMAFVESLEAVRAATALDRGYRHESTSWTSEVIPGPSTFSTGPCPRSSHANSRRRRRHLLRLAFRST